MDSPDRELHVLLEPVLRDEWPGELVDVVPKAPVHTKHVVAPCERALTCGKCYRTI